MNQVQEKRKRRKERKGKEIGEERFRFGSALFKERVKEKKEERKEQT